MRVLAGLATFVAAAALACVVAFWGWRVMGPRTASLPPPAPADPAATLIAAIAAVLGGIVLLGSNRSTAREATALRAAAEGRRD